ncbi:hypothetical protein [Actinomyces faecalis]|uniref:hypothetical protein n=1 Tax=Actinomyces faecalis TaxID=2722820 RepID=UPI0015576B40|nr:hypothetical protein [Actinomyces faecalis]
MTSGSNLVHFILVYDHRRGDLREEIPFGSNSKAAVEAYTSLERQYKDDKGIEIVLVGADSFDTIRQTHANYFADSREDLITEPLLKGLLDAVGS